MKGRAILQIIAEVQERKDWNIQLVSKQYPPSGPISVCRKCMQKVKPVGIPKSKLHLETLETCGTFWRQKLKLPCKDWTQVPFWEIFSPLTHQSNPCFFNPRFARFQDSRIGMNSSDIECSTSRTFKTLKWAILKHSDKLNPIDPIISKLQTSKS